MVIDNIYDNSLSKTSNTISGPLCEKSVFCMVRISTMMFWRHKNQKINFYTKKTMTIIFQSILHKATEFHLI